MKRFLSAILIAVSLFGLSSCKSGNKALLPNVSGKAGEVLVVIEKHYWDGEVGDVLRANLACDCDYLPQPEPLYDLAYVTPNGFTNMFQAHRNILMIHIDSAVKEPDVEFRNNRWAKPQCIIVVNADSPEEMVELLNTENEKIKARLEQAERDRVVANARLYEETQIRMQLAEVFGGSIVFPSGYKLKKVTHDFAWAGYDNTYVYRDILVYRYPVECDDELSPERMLEHRNKALKENVPGMFEGSYMTTSAFLDPSVKYLNYKGHAFAEMRGYWEVQNDFMGGPFVSHSFYSLDGSEILVFEAFVYAPKYEKRQYMRQTEALLYSFQWADTMLEEKD